MSGMRIFVLAVALFLVLISISLPSDVGAQTVAELRAQIEEQNAKLKELEAEIAKYEGELQKVGAEKSTLQKAIKELDITRQKLAADIRITENRIQATTLQIGELESEILTKGEHIELNEEAIARAIRRINELENESLIEQILVNRRFSDVWDQVSTLEQFQGTVREDIQTLLALKDDLESTKAEEEEKRNDLASFRKNLSGQKQVLDVTRSQKNNLLDETKNEEANYQALLEERRAAKAQFERQLQDLESQLQFTLDPSRIPSRGEGVLAWPVKDVYITQEFGHTADSGRLYRSGTHNGVDFRASIGTPIYSALAGEVIAVNTKVASFCQYGKWVLVRHFNGLTTLYAHLSLVSVDSGDSVRTGDLLGYSGDTGYALGPHLHFTVYASDAVEFKQYTCNSGVTLTIPVSAPSGYLDPLSFL